ncbi:MAG: methyltransferase domain-containing protein [Planctomycetia bacterium]|nr:methyltransferase domain-containing protein [Planctomycetia bacterium]
MDLRHQKIFNEQDWYSKEIINPLFGEGDYSGNRILEIGCAEGGGLHFFANSGPKCYGIEYSYSRFSSAVEESNSVGITIIHGDILNPDTYKKKIQDQFDYIILRDVIEHLDDQVLALKNIKQLLKPKGKLFISFPPKYSPYAGHQQNATNQFGRLPYIFMLPTSLYRGLLQLISQKQGTINNLLSIKRTRLSIREFEHLFSQMGFKQFKRTLYSIRPCYEFRFGWRKRKNPFGSFPIIRELITLGALYILKNND